MASYTFIACEDDPERGINAGDMFVWDNHTGAARLRQIREWKNAALTLELLSEGLVVPLDAATPDLLTRQRVGEVRPGPPQHPIRVLK